MSKDSLATLRRRIGIVFQDFRLLDHMTTYENVALPFRVMGKDEASYRDEVVELLHWVGLGDRMGALPPVLSGGEKQRAAIARAVIARPQLLLADEPTGNVDPNLAQRLLRLFIELNKSGTTVVIATHDISLMDQYDCPPPRAARRPAARVRLRHAMTEHAHRPAHRQELMTPRAMAGLLPRSESPIVPKRSIAGRALVAVVAIMTFLASLTTGAVMLVRSAAVEWQSDVAREVTIQVRPAQGRDLEAEVARAVEIARAFPGVGEVRPYSKEEFGAPARAVARQRACARRSAGAADDRGEACRPAAVDLAPLRKALAERVAGASLDDHRAWIERMRTMAQTTIAGGIGLLILMLAATVLSVIFATRGAMATNRPIVEVLHFIGAKSGFIAGQFQRHFLLLGLEGGLIGGGLAMLLFGAGRHRRAT